MIISKTPILLVHLLGLCLSIGPVLLIDARMVRVLLGGAVKPDDVDLIEVLSPWIRLGLVLLWVSGAGFLLHYAVHTPEALGNPKLHAKLLVVGILTANGVLVERYVFEQLRERIGQSLFVPADMRQHLAVLAIAAVSATGWYTALVLGATRELNFACEVSTILATCGIAVFAAFAALWTVTRITRPAAELALDAIGGSGACERRSAHVDVGGRLS